MPSDTINGYAAHILPDGESFEQRKRRRTEHGSVSAQFARATQEVAAEGVVDPLNVGGWSPRAKYLISKMRLLRFVDESTPSYIIVWLAKIADKLFIYAGYGRSGDAKALLKRIHVGHAGIDAALNMDYSELDQSGEDAARENKEIYWTFASAFLICFFEVKAKKQFCVQYYHPRTLVEQFLKLYPEFTEHDGLLINRLLTFHLCMQVAVSAFSGSAASASEAACLVELVTRMTEGRELALGCSSGLAHIAVLGTTPAANINKNRKDIFKKIFEIKLDPSKYQGTRARDGGRADRQVRFAAELEAGPSGAAGAEDLVGTKELLNGKSHNDTIAV